MRLKIAAGLAVGLSLCSGARGQHWERLGPEGGMVVSLGTDPGGGVYLGTADGHIFASADAAHSWELHGRVGSRLDAVVTRLVVDPREASRVFAAVWYREAGAGGGVFRSRDGGRKWELMGLEGEVVRALEIAPSQPEELVAGTRSGVFRSLDQGGSWERISPEGDAELRNVDSIAIDPRDPKVIYVGTYHLPWRTLDGGKTWKPVTAGIIDDSDIMSLWLDASNPERVYMSACSGIYRSENQGGAWTKLQGIPYAARRTQVIVQDITSPKTLYAGTTEGLWVTRDGGESWTRTTPKDWVVNSVIVLGAKSGGPGRVVLGTEGRGVEVSEDSGASFAEANRGFAHVIVKQLVADRKKPQHLLMVVERNGIEILESRDEAKNWVAIPLEAEEHGKVATLRVDQVEEVFAAPWGWLLRMENGQLWTREEEEDVWKEWKSVLAAGTPRATPQSKRTKREAERAVVTGSVVAFSGNAAVVSMQDSLLRCLESGMCRRLNAFGGKERIRAVWISIGGREIGAVVGGKLGWSTDGGETAAWRDLPVAEEQVEWLDVDESNPAGTEYLGTSTGLFYSHDSGAHWQRMEAGLPAGRVERWMRQQGFWVLTERDGGIYFSLDGGSSWRRADEDAERSRFAGLAASRSGALLAGSQSEGLLRLEVAGSAGKL